MNNILGYPRKVLSDAQNAVRAVKALRGKPDGFVGTDTDGYADLTQLGSGTPTSSLFLRGDGIWASSSSSSGTVVTSGSTSVDFGSFPGSSEATATVSGQTGILAGSRIKAWLSPVATADHSADEHRVEDIDVYAGNLVAGTGFTIYAQFRNSGNTRAYGTWTVAWEWF